MLRGLAFVLALAGCQLGGAPGAPPDVAAPSAIQGPAVEVSALAPMAGEPAAAPLQPLAPTAVPRPEAAAPPPEPVAVIKTPGHIACEKRGGNFVALGRSGAMICQLPTRDGGKQCRRESDCDGVCLARSGTCAPVKPLLGCQAILQDDGRRVQLCID